MSKERTYVCIDLKSFYASVECVERNLNPLTTNLVVADSTRTQKTICLAVSPSLKSYGIPGRLRLFELVQKVKEINNSRAQKAKLIGESYDNEEIKKNDSLSLSYIVAPPRMAHYIKYSSKIYEIYLKYISKDDIHVYSIDEVFMDVTDYLKSYKMTPYELVNKIIKDVYTQTKITATAGIGTNMYLAKVAMDIVAKHVKANKDGVRLASLNELEYRKLLWDHKPLTDFWRVGRGYVKKLEEISLYTMGDIARCSLGKFEDYYNEDLLYKIFGINAELLIDHAWGYESCSIKEIKKYKPMSSSLGSGQVLSCPYDYKKAKIVIKEMADALALDLVAKNLVANQIVISVGYDISNLNNNYNGKIVIDYYGRNIPQHAHGSINLNIFTSSSKKIMQAAIQLFDQIVDKNLYVKRLNIAAINIIDENLVDNTIEYEQLNLFVDYTKKDKMDEIEKIELEKEKKRQKAILDIKNKYGKNSIIKVMDLQEGATTKERNNQIGGHKA